MSDFLEGEVADHLLRTGSWTKPTILAVALCTAAPIDADTSADITEVTDAGAYARVDRPPLDANWTNPAAAGLSDNVAAIAFTTATANWAAGAVTHFAICSVTGHLAAGDMYIHGALTTARTVLNGDTFSFPIGDLDITFA